MIVAGYLLYTIVEAFGNLRQEGDYYRLLGVTPFADDRTIKTRFRRLAAQHHPDKAGYTNGAGSVDFVLLKAAYDTVMDPVRRFAYDRFGPQVASWRAEEDRPRWSLLLIGLGFRATEYTIGFLTMLAMNSFWWASWGRYVSWFASKKLETTDMF